MAIPFVREFDPAYGEIRQVSPRVQRLVADNPGPFTYAGTGVFIIGGETCAVIDPGPDTPAHRDALWRALEGRRVSHVLCTHHHLDHTPLARPLAEAHDCKVHGMRVKSAPAFESELVLEEGVDASFRPDVEMVDGDMVEGPGWTLEALHTPGHTSNHLCFALTEENALFTGDHIMGWATSVVVPPDGDMRDYMASLRRVRERGFATLYPTHGPEITEPGPFIDAYIAHREAREAQIVAQLEAGVGDIPTMVEAMYKAVDARLHPAAAMSVTAHLLHMEAEGRAVKTGVGWRLP